MLLLVQVIVVVVVVVVVAAVAVVVVAAAAVWIVPYLLKVIDNGAEYASKMGTEKDGYETSQHQRRKFPGQGKCGIHRGAFQNCSDQSIRNDGERGNATEWKD